MRAGSFGGGAGETLLVVAGVHGDEPCTVEAAIELVGRLRARPPADRAVWVVPALNPDGVVGGTKDSARGVDLNRNFPARNFSANHQSGYFPGERPLCEPETAALAGLIDRIGVTGVVALHAPFACVNFDGPAEAWARAVAAASGWPVRADLGYPTPGSLGSWLGVDRNIPILTLEFPGGPLEGFRAAAEAALQSAINPPRIR